MQQICNGRGQEFGPGSRRTRFEEHVRTSDVTKLPKAFLERRDIRALRRRKEPSRVHLPRLRPSNERRKNEAESNNGREPDQPHGHLCGGWLVGSLAERHDGTSRAP